MKYDAQRSTVQVHFFKEVFDEFHVLVGVCKVTEGLHVIADDVTDIVDNRDGISFLALLHR